MKDRKIPLNLNCGLDLIGEVLYGKWKIRLLWFISQGHQRPSELQTKIPDASRRVLNIQLKELEEHDLVAKKIYPVVPPKVEYSLTAFGQTVIPIIAVLGNWGNENEERLRKLILNAQSVTDGLEDEVIGR
ncbi:transcriptional regulator [Pedobacter sp. G11]|uniref:winged helix-turn-helix transcriptional regulator n=1 Tax=Pedobacter sp. G11 TaxID=2482728 RepID=UPI000F5E813C|nr:helix-turn-helix domain-containing protein [Pedobacter sp. G11]AZI27644.1 transcriptional regulator [Pedobacter sp. G11]